MSMLKKIREYKELLNDEDVKSISRRYFISNGFDGALTGIGVSLGSFLSGITVGVVVVKIGIATTIGLSTSGVWSVWEIERAEKKAELKKVENALLESLEGTEIKSKKYKARVINSIASGMGPPIGLMLPMLPFLLEGVFYNIFWATIFSVIVTLSILFVFGSYMGLVSKHNWFVAGIRMALGGLVAGGLNLILSL